MGGAGLLSARFNGPTTLKMQRLVAANEITDFVQRCMEAVGAAGPHAASLADVLLAADMRGHYSHGLNKLGTQRRVRCRSHNPCALYRTI